MLFPTTSQALLNESVTNNCRLPNCCGAYFVHRLQESTVGLQVISSAHREDLLVAFMSASEDSIAKRQPPTAFLEASNVYNEQALL